MSVLVFRIDDRLIHGQVIEGWVRGLGVNHIVTVSDEIACDRVQQTLFSLAVPGGIRLSCLSVKEMAEKWRRSAFEHDRLLVLLPSPREALRLIESGVEIKSLNIGGMHFSPGKIQLLMTLSVDSQDYSDLQAIIAHGVTLEGRILPRDPLVDVAKILTEASEKISKLAQERK